MGPLVIVEPEVDAQFPAGLCGVGVGFQVHLVSWFRCVTITSARRTRVRQTDDTQVMEDHRGASVAAPTTSRARTVAWANGARIVQGRATLTQEVKMEGETRFVGIDVSKAQVDVAVRPAGQMSMALRSWATGVSKFRINVRLSGQHKCHSVRVPWYQMMALRGPPRVAVVVDPQRPCIS